LDAAAKELQGDSSPTPGSDEKSPAAKVSRPFSRDRVRSVILFTFTAITVILCLGLAAPFVPAITWSLALAVVAHPLHAWVEKRLPGKPDLASVLATAIVAIGLLAPVVLVVQQLAQQSTSGLGELQEMVKSGTIKQRLESDPKTAIPFQWIEANFDLEKEVENLSAGVRQSIGGWIKGTVWNAVQLLVTVLLLFYLFRDRVEALRALRSYLPLSRRESDMLLERIRSMIHATVFGSLTVAGIQGVLGGLMFWFLGLPGVLLWGAVMALFALVPVVGTFVVWLPAAAFLAAQGSWGKALILTLWGAIVVSMIDNLLYPILVGEEIQIHTALVFMAIAGGLVLFGVSGLVLGPVALVTAIALIEVLSRRASSGNSQSKQAT
jgi:predicted PurR-regulated permease PerM